VTSGFPDVLQRFSILYPRSPGIIKSYSVTVQPDGSLNAGLDLGLAEGLADSGGAGTAAWVPRTYVRYG
jgi:hypothetical protein